MHWYPIRHQNKSYDYGNNNKYSQKEKIQLKSALRKFRSHLNHKLFSEYFVQGPLKNFSKPMADIYMRRM